MFEVSGPNYSIKRLWLLEPETSNIGYLGPLGSVEAIYFCFNKLGGPFFGLAIYPKGPSTNILRTLGFYIGIYYYGLCQVLII